MVVIRYTSLNKFRGGLGLLLLLLLLGSAVVKDRVFILTGAPVGGLVTFAEGELVGFCEVLVGHLEAVGEAVGEGEYAAEAMQQHDNANSITTTRVRNSIASLRCLQHRLAPMYEQMDSKCK